MKYLKTFELSENNFTKENSEILNTIDILTSFVDDLVQLKFEEGLSPRKPIDAYARCGGQRYNLIDFSKYVNDNINKPISTIEWSLSGGARNVDTNELDLSSNDFMSRLKELAPNCRINNFRKTINKDETIIYTKGNHIKTVKSDATINLQILDSNKTRYKNLFISQ